MSSPTGAGWGCRQGSDVAVTAPNTAAEGTASGLAAAGHAVTEALRTSRRLSDVCP